MFRQTKQFKIVFKLHEVEATAGTSARAPHAAEGPRQHSKG